MMRTTRLKLDDTFMQPSVSSTSEPDLVPSANETSHLDTSHSAATPLSIVDVDCIRVARYAPLEAEATKKRGRPKTTAVTRELYLSYTSCR